MKISNKFAKYVQCRIERYIPNGCVFKLNLKTGTEQLKKVKIKLSAGKQWQTVKNKNDYEESEHFYYSEKKENLLFVKIENLSCCKETDFEFSFQETKGGVLIPYYCMVLIPGMHLNSFSIFQYSNKKETKVKLNQPF